jgi:hypothetical protein
MSGSGQRRGWVMERYLHVNMWTNIERRKTRDEEKMAGWNKWVRVREMLVEDDGEGREGWFPDQDNASEWERKEHTTGSLRIPQITRTQPCSAWGAHSILVLGWHDNVSVSTLNHIPHAIHCRRSAARLVKKVWMLELSATLMESPALAKDFEGIVDGDLAKSTEMDKFKMSVKRALCCMSQVVDGR